MDPRCTGTVNRIARFQMVNCIGEGQQRVIYHLSEVNPVANRSGLIQACYSRRPGIWDDGQDDVSSKQTPRAKVIKLASTSSTSQTSLLWSYQFRGCKLCSVEVFFAASSFAVSVWWILPQAGVSLESTYQAFMSVHSFSAASHHATLQKGQVCDRSSRLWSTTELSAS